MKHIILNEAYTYYCCEESRCLHLACSETETPRGLLAYSSGYREEFDKCIIDTRQSCKKSCSKILRKPLNADEAEFQQCVKECTLSRCKATPAVKAARETAMVDRQV